MSNKPKETLAGELWGPAPNPPRFNALLLRGSGQQHLIVAFAKKGDALWHRPIEDQMVLGSHLCVALSSVSGEVRIP